ncbi:MAG: fimbrial assembly protein [Bdellovibrio sp. ArHS]|uniref:pilus assembly protein PilP n=1 Tax=Bdellovibrio sp. ArHS TaxID=1569284 RepID=UPI000582F888|nr:pilus assembly protein PilP [Bdellovibrio sp. ArHS]KHD89949.1 MAG: fimbrial assembly protein [Bdellovibrio sp. ArHS]
MKSVRWIVSYILVAAIGLWLAFAVSVRFITPAQSQEAPSSGDLPADFLKEVEATQVPPTGGTGKPAAAPAETPAAQTPPAAQPTVPPPPMDIPVGDTVTAPAPSASDILPRDGYMYDPTGKRDPFKPFRTVRPTLTEANKSAAEVLEPLQRWETDRLQIVGILWDVSTPRAMVRDPDGAVFTVTKNSKIGRNEGFVAAIREGEIVVVETKYEDGKSIKESRILELRK